MLGEVVDRTNAERARHGLRALTVDQRLAAAAQAHSADMVRRGFFAHESPDGRQVWDRAVAAGYAYRKVAENIAAGQRTAEEVVRGWMDSPGHRANILDARPDPDRRRPRRRWLLWRVLDASVRHTALAGPTLNG